MTLFVQLLIFGSTVPLVAQDKQELSLQKLPPAGVYSVLLVDPNGLRNHSLIKPFVQKNPKYQFLLAADGFFKNQIGVSVNAVAQYGNLEWQALKKPGLAKDDWRSYNFLGTQFVQTKRKYRNQLEKISLELKEEAGLKIHRVVEENRQMAQSFVNPFVIEVDERTVAICSKPMLKLLKPSFNAFKNIQGKPSELASLLKPHITSSLLFWQRNPSSFPFSSTNSLVRIECQSIFGDAFKNTETVLFSINTQKAPLHWYLRMEQKTEDSAKQLESRLNTSLKRYQTLCKDFLNHPSKDVAIIAKSFQEVLSKVEVERSKKTVVAKGDLILSARCIKALLRKYEHQQKIELSEARLKNVSIALNLFCRENGRYPSAVYTHKSGHQHSWRIMLLPYLGHQDLFDQYRLNEPWDSAHNRKVTDKMPDAFRHPLASDQDSPTSGFSVVTGIGTAFPPNPKNKNFGPAIEDFIDGRSNTIVAVETSMKKHWADPTTLSFEDVVQGKNVGGFGKNIIRVTFADGSVSSIRQGASEGVLKAIFSIGGNDLFETENFLAPSIPLQELTPKR